MTDYTRFALYFTLPDGPLAALSAAWLGWDIAQGTPCPHPILDGLPLPVEDITATPRKYGFHGTLKPPFRLAEGKTPAALREAVEGFAATQPAFEIPGLHVEQLGAFLALIPIAPSAALGAFAAACVRDLEPFRAPLNEAELARRRKAALSPAQEALLAAWGYPYVMDEFRFHMTLSGRLNDEVAMDTRAVLRPYFADALPRPFPIDAVTLCGERADGRFETMARLPLTG